MPNKRGGKEVFSKNLCRILIRNYAPLLDKTSTDGWASDLGNFMIANLNQIVFDPP